jgi:hypothetical protein
MDDIEQIAQRLGMKQSEITDVVPVGDGAAVQTHDGQWTLITNDNELVFGIGDPTATDAEDGKPAVVGERGPEDVAVPPKTTVKRRSSR